MTLEVRNCNQSTNQHLFIARVETDASVIVGERVFFGLTNPGFIQVSLIGGASNHQ